MACIVGCVARDPVEDARLSSIDAGGETSSADPIRGGSSPVGGVISVREADCDTTELAGDCDEDGILNAIENYGKTDVNNADTDGDGWCDGPNDVEGVCVGGEDLNANGKEEPGEFDPTDPDDTPPPNSLVGRSIRLSCPRQPWLTTHESPLPSAGLTLVSHQPLHMSEHGFTSGGPFFSNDDHTVFGYVVPEWVRLSTVDQAHDILWQALLDQGDPFTSVFRSVPFISSTTHRELGFYETTPNAIRGRLHYEYGAFDPSVSSKSPGALRDEIYLALTDLPALPVESAEFSERGRPCSRLEHRYIVEVFGRHSLVLGVIACHDDISSSPDNDLFMADMVDSSNYALVDLDYVSAYGRFCEQHVINGPGLVDLLWVVDNTASMAAAQHAIADTIDPLLERFNASHIDWRMGMVSTDAYCLARDTSGDAITPICDTSQSGIPGNDALLTSAQSQCSGLRGQGFVSRDDANASTLVRQYLTENSLCDLSTTHPGALPGQNLCGFSEPSGLRATLFAQERLSSGACNSHRHRFREGATVVTIIVSNNADQDFKDDESLLPNLSPLREARTQTYIDAFGTRDLRVFAIVPDDTLPAVPSVEATGPCANLTSLHGMGYRTLVEETRGVWGSICRSNLSDTLLAMAEDVIHDAIHIPLEVDAISSSILVAINGELLARHPGPDGNLPYWRYGRVVDKDTGRARPVVSLANLDSLALPPNLDNAFDDDDVVTIGYRVWGSLE